MQRIGVFVAFWLTSATLWAQQPISGPVTRQAIQDAIDAADAAGGGQVVLPGESVTIDQTIRLPVGVSLRGQGSSATELISTVDSGPAIRMVGRSPNQSQTENALHNHALEALQIRTPADQGAAKGVELLGCRHARVRDVTVWSQDPTQTPLDNGIGIHVLPGDGTESGGHKGSAYLAFEHITAGKMQRGIYLDMTPDNDGLTFVNRTYGHDVRLQSCDIGLAVRGYVTSDGTSDTQRSDSHQWYAVRTAGSKTHGIELVGVGDTNWMVFCEDPDANQELFIGANCVRNQVWGTWSTAQVDAAVVGANWLINPALEGARLWQLRVNDLQLDDELAIANANNAAVTALQSAIYGTGGGGSGPFGQAGNLILQPRTDGADRHVAVIAGDEKRVVAEFHERSVRLREPVTLRPGPVPPAPAAGHVTLFVDESDGDPKAIDDSGNVVTIADFP